MKIRKGTVLRSLLVAAGVVMVVALIAGPARGRGPPHPAGRA